MDISEITGPAESDGGDNAESSGQIAAYRNSPIPTMIIDLPGKVIDANRAAQSIFGHKLKRKSWGSIYEILSGRSIMEDTGLYKCLKSRAFSENGSATLIEDVAFPDGTLKTFKITCSRVDRNDDDGNREIYAVYFQDITKLQKTSRKSHEKDSFLNSIFRASPLVIGTVLDRQIVDANDRFFNMLGYTRDEVLGKSARMLYPTEDDYNYVGTEKYRQIEEDGVGMVTTRWMKKNGDVLDVMLSSAVTDPNDPLLGHTFIAWDITEQKRNERKLNRLVEQLRASEEKYRKLIEISPNAIFLTSGCESIEECNPATEKLLGAPRDELIGSNYRDFFTGWKIFTQNLEEIDNAIEEKGYYLYKEFEFTNNLGRTYYLNLFITFVMLDGKFYTLTTGHDVTDLVLYRKKIEKSRRNLQLVNKELKSFSFSITHELRAPLRRIKGFSEILMEDFNDILGEDERDIFGRVVSNVNLMEEQIKGMLSLSKVTQQKLNIQSVNLSELVMNTLRTYQSTESERAAEFDVEPDVMVHADPTLFQILIQNLVDNAWKFSSERDVTRIRFGRTNDLESSSNGGGSQGNVFFLKDNGVGFDYSGDDDYRTQRLFAPFQRLHSDREFHGIGIGMATVKRIINLHDGDIWVKSRRNEGTTVFFKLSSPSGV